MSPPFLLTIGAVMATKDDRRLTLLDAMVLLAAGAPGLALLRPSSPTISKELGWIPWQDVTLPGTLWVSRLLGGPGFTMDLLMDFLDIVLPFLAIGTPAVLALRWLQPRPPWRALVQQPGLAACSAAMVGLFAALWLWSYRIRLAPLLPGGLVGVVWLGLAASRYWHPEPSWIDRAGRALGIGWLVTVPLFVWFTQNS
jgi:hypothetical protein